MIQQGTASLCVFLFVFLVEYISLQFFDVEPNYYLISFISFIAGTVGGNFADKNTGRYLRLISNTKINTTSTTTSTTSSEKIVDKIVDNPLAETNA